MTKWQLEKVGIFTLTKPLTVTMTFLGLIAGLVYSFGGLIVDILVSVGWVSTTETPGLSYGTVLAFGALIGMPLIGAAFGLIVGIMATILNNIIVGFYQWNLDKNSG